jgi:oligoendopeptidase F
MTEQTLPPRSDIAEKFTWNAPSVFSSKADWEAELKSVAERLPGIQARFKGRLGDDPAVLADYFELFDDLYGRVGKIYVYASMFSAVDANDQAASAMAGQAISLYSQLAAAVAFAEPEILTIGPDALTQWMVDETRLAIYKHYFENLFRQQEHIRSADVEEVLGMAVDVFGTISKTASQLANADLKFQPATTWDGETISVEQGNFLLHMTSPDRELRRTAWNSYLDGYLAFKNTFTSNLNAAIKRDVLLARVRRHGSALEAALFPNNIPVEVFHNLIDTFRKHLPTWHRYWAIRKRALGVETLHPYDGWAPLTGSKANVPYPQAVEWISAGMAPLGEDYVQPLRRGCLEDRWVDVYPNQGKRQGAFSSGWKGTLPFIMMSYNDTLNSMSTLAHELGHSLHSYLTWQHQPMVYSDYSLFVAEVASNFNQAMVRAHLLQLKHDDPAFQIAVLEEAMANFLRYFFIMPTLARFELDMHERVERSEGLTADTMIAVMADLFAEGYGDEVEIDREQVGMFWATFNHLYANFYVFQYATGISAAHALAQGVLEGQSNAVENYLSFLKAGGSLYPLDALKLAGVDMTTPKAVETTFAIMADYVDQLDRLTNT